MLYELFSWIKGSDVTLPFSHQIITQSLFESEYQSASHKRREILASLHAARLGSASPVSVSKIAEDIAHHDAYLEFLVFFRSEMGEHESYSPFLVALNYLLSVPCEAENRLIREEKINNIFYISLQENKEKTLGFFYKNQQFLSDFSQINLMVSAQKVMDNFAQLTLQLQYQEHPLSIAHFFRQFLDDTEKFAAAILWLLQRGVTVEKILATGLLQDFMSYHVAWLDSSDSAIHHLYKVLARFPQTESLIAEARKVQCELRGLYGGAGSGRAYAITGVLCEQSTLRVVEKTSPTLAFTPTPQNFATLQQLFGEQFIHDALVWFADGENAAWRAVLHDFLNHDETIETKLPALINGISTTGPLSLLKTLSSLIDDITVEKLLARQSGAVLHFLPYKPLLITKIGERDIRHYLEAVETSDEAAWNIIPQLLALFVAFRDINKEAAILVYDALLDLVLHYPQFLDDDGVIKKLKKFSEKEMRIANRCRHLQSQFDRCIVEQTTGPLTIDSYYNIEDTWREISRQFDVLGEIVPLISYCPADKYKLQAYLAKVYFAKGTLVLDDFISAIGIAAELVDEYVSEYERLLIEILMAIDDERIRQTIIEKFEGNAAKRQRWMSLEYGENSVFMGAVKQGNIGLVTWLAERITLNVDDIDRAVLMAVEMHQWNLVNYFINLSTPKPQQDTLKEVLYAASKEGQLATVNLLCSGAITHLRTKHTEEALIRAAVNGHKAVAEYLCSLSSNAPSSAAIARALKLALQFGQRELITSLGNLPATPQLLTTVERALVHAATQDQLDIVRLLCSLITNTPRPVIIEEAFIKAVKFGHLSIAQHLSGLAGAGINQKTVDAALHDVMNNEFLPGIQYLCALAIPPSQAAIESALQKAVRCKRLDIVAYLCSLTPAPRLRAIEQALQAATKAECLPIAKHLCSLVSPKVIEEIIQLAARQGQLAMVQHGCSLIPLTKKILRYAQKKASSYGHEEVADYLQGLLVSLRPTHLEIPDDDAVSDDASAFLTGSVFSSSLPYDGVLPHIGEESHEDSSLRVEPVYHGGTSPQGELLFLPCDSSVSAAGPLRRVESLCYTNNMPEVSVLISPRGGSVRRCVSCSALEAIGFFSSRKVNANLPAATVADGVTAAVTVATSH